MTTTIEIRNFSGQVEQRELTKTEPLSIGSHPASDIRVDEQGVSVLHCRVSWNGSSYEVVAAGSQGVEVNGKMVHHSSLQLGDVLRIGSVDIALFESEPPPAPQRDDEIALKPITESEIEIPVRAVEMARLVSGPGKPSPPQTPAKEAQPPEDPQPWEDPEHSALLELDDELEDDLLEDADEQEMLRPGRGPGKGRRGLWPNEWPFLARLVRRLRGEPVRPGEQDVLRSPFVLGLGGGSLALLLAALSVWFIIGRETAQRQYDAALGAFGAGNYRKAEQIFDKFLKQHPRHRYSELAHYGLGKARIGRELSGAAPHWSRGLEEVQRFIEKHRDRPNYGKQKSMLRDFAEQIATGSAQSASAGAAGANTKVSSLQDLLVISEQASRLLDRLSPPEDPPVQLQRQIADLIWRANKAIEKKDVFEHSLTDIKQAVEEKKPMQALEARRLLLARYVEFAGELKLARLLKATLNAERELVVRDELNRPAVSDSREPATPRPLSLTFHVRSRTDENSAGRTVIAVARDCCYGIDTVTGDPSWRRVIGLDTPFFPMSVETSVEGLLLFDTNHRELILIDRLDGHLVWREPLGEEVSGPPLIHEGQIYLPTLSKHLYQIVLETGHITARMTFSQPILTPPVLLANGTRMIVAGHQSMLYTLSLRPLSCESVSFSDHQPGTIQAPLLAMGSLLLITQNDRRDNSRLRVFELRGEQQRLQEVAAARVDGHIHDRPVIRGRQLFVASSPERITAFSVSDENDQEPLTQLASNEIQSGHAGPLFLKAGADGRLWMAGSAFREFRLKIGSIAYDEGGAVAIGISTQPLQLVDRYFYLGRRLPYHRAVIFTPVEREQMSSHWKTILGSSLLAWVGSSANSIVGLNETGEIFRVDLQELEAGGFHHRPTDQLEIDEATSSPLKTVTLRDGRLAVWVGPTKPHLWIINSTGRVERKHALEQPLEANPVVIEAGIVLPLPDRLKLLPHGADAAEVKDYSTLLESNLPENHQPNTDPKQRPRWKHLIALENDRLLAVDDHGLLTRIQFRSAPVPHLAKVDRVRLEHKLDVGLLVHDGQLFLADSASRLRLFNLETMEPIAEIKLAAPASRRPWLIAGRLYVETADAQLHCFRFETEFKKLWTCPLEEVPLSGRPLPVGDQVIVSRANGSVWAIDAQSGDVRNRVSLGQPANLGPLHVGSLIVLPTIDGSLHRIESILQAPPEQVIP